MLLSIVVAGGLLIAQAPRLGPLDELLAAARWEEAERAAEELRAQLVGADEPLLLAAVLDRLVRSRIGVGRSMEPDSLELAREALRLRQESIFDSGGDTTGGDGSGDARLVAESLYTLGALHLDRAELGDAVSTLRRAVDLLEERGGGDDPLLASSLERLGVALMEAEDLEQARSILERSHAMRVRLFGEEHPAVAEVLASLGDFLSRIGDVEAAEDHLRRAIAIQERALGSQDPRLAATLSILAKLDSRRGRYEESGRLLERVLAIQTSALGPEHPEVARTLDLLARTSFSTGDFEDARERWQRSLEIQERVLGAEHPEVATVLSNLASLSLQVGDYPEAQRLFERAERIYEATLGPEHSFVASMHHNLGRVYHKTGDYEGAREHYRLALELKEKALGPGHPSLGPTLISYAGLLRDLGEDQAASELYERALHLYEGTLGSEHPNVAAIANSLALSQARAGAAAAAESSFRRSLAIYQRSMGSASPDVAKVMGNLATMYRDHGRPAAALGVYERALGIARESLGVEHPDVARLLTEEAVLHYRTGAAERALEVGLEAEDIGRQHLRLTILTFSERRALRYAAVRAPGLDVALTVAADGDAQGRASEVWQSLTDSRTLVLDEMAARNRAAWASRREGTEAALDEMQEASEALARLLVEEVGGGAGAERREALESARRRRDRAERALAESSAVFRRDRGRASIALNDVVAALPPKSALLAFARYRRIPREPAPPGSDDGGATAAYVAFVVAPGVAAPAVVDLGEAKRIDRLISSWWREAARSPHASGRTEGESQQVYRQVGGALRAAVWDPVVGATGGAERVFVVADGMLHLVNLAALPSGAGGYLVEDGPILHLVSSERELVPLAERTGEGLLAVGDPAFDESSREDGEGGDATAAMPGDASARRSLTGGCGSLDELRFGDLPGTRMEMDEVVALWRDSAEGPVVRLEGAQASEEAVKRLAPGRRVLHLATHGFFLGESCPATAAEETRGVGGLTAGGDLAARTGEKTNPFLLSGLALAGANRRQERSPELEDGILTAEELANLDLMGIEWAVLSACDTGLGPVADGEGVFGLRRALRIAGARTVVLSLWSVEDQAARSWMRHLYGARLKEGLDTSRSVQEASRRALEERRASGASTHPFYWGGFVASGEWR